MKNILKNISHPSKVFWENKKVLITGHNGFKGSWMTLWLSEFNADISGISITPVYSPTLFDQLELEKKIDHNLLDIRKAEELLKLVRHIEPDVVFHLAAQPLVLESYSKPLETWETNVKQAENQEHLRKHE